MKIVLIALGFVGAGLIGAVAARELFPGDAPEMGAPSALASVEARIDDIEAQVARLTEEVRARRDAGIVPNAPPPFSDDPAAAIPLDAAPPSDGPAAITDDQIERKVVETVEKIARARAAEKARRAEEIQLAKEREWLATKQKEIGLTDYQVEELGRMIVARRRAIAGFKRKMAAAPDGQKADIQQAMMDYRRQLDGELRKLLSGDQYDAIMNPQRRKGNGKSR